MDFDYTAHYEKLSAAVKREVAAEFVGYDGNNVYAVAAGHGDYFDIVQAFLFDIGITSVSPMVDNAQHLKNFEDNAGLRYAYGTVQHKTSEETFRKILKKYRGYVAEFKKRYDLIKQEIENKNQATMPQVEHLTF